jgi:hypothetical protein
VVPSDEPADEPGVALAVPLAGPAVEPAASVPLPPLPEVMAATTTAPSATPMTKVSAGSNHAARRRARSPLAGGDGLLGESLSVVRPRVAGCSLVTPSLAGPPGHHRAHI